MSSGEWEAIKREARGVLEKLASATSREIAERQRCGASSHRHPHRQQTPLLRSHVHSTAMTRPLLRSHVCGHDTSTACPRRRRSPSARTSSACGRRGRRRLRDTSTTRPRHVHGSPLQERWVYAADDALCYQHLNSEVEPIGAPEPVTSPAQPLHSHRPAPPPSLPPFPQAPPSGSRARPSEPAGPSRKLPGAFREPSRYSSVEFVGPFDETQFVIKCAGRVSDSRESSREAQPRSRLADSPPRDAASRLSPRLHLGCTSPLRPSPSSARRPSSARSGSRTSPPSPAAPPPPRSASSPKPWGTETRGGSGAAHQRGRARVVSSSRGGSEGLCETGLPHSTPRHSFPRRPPARGGGASVMSGDVLPFEVRRPLA